MGRRGTEDSSLVSLMELASGGMGTVELAVRRHGGFERLYAVKRLHPRMRDDESFVEMFLDEARIAGLIRHPNVVSVLDVMADESGPMLVMGYVEGVSANQLVKRTRHRGERLPCQLAVQIVEQAARGLHAAHETRGHDGEPLGIVHRDVSPQNILIGFILVAGAALAGAAGVAIALTGHPPALRSPVLKRPAQNRSAHRNPTRYSPVQRRSRTTMSPIR